MRTIRISLAFMCVSFLALPGCAVKPGAGSSVSSQASATAYPSVKTQPIGFCQQLLAAIAVDDSETMNHLFIASSSGPKVSPAEVRKAMEPYTGAVHALSKGETPILKQINESRTRQGFSTVIQTWQVSATPLYAGCMVYRNEDGRFVIDLQMSTDLGKVQGNLENERRQSRATSLMDQSI
jgi:hypothetical protein